MKVLHSTQLDLLRHGECEGGAIFRGSSDVKLLPEGLAKMQRRCRELGEAWDLIISSPLQRCREFATRWSRQHNIELQIENELQEIHFGEWEGQQIDTLWQQDRQRLQAWSLNPEAQTAPGGEAIHEVHARVKRVLTRIEESQRGKKILLVIHGGIIRVALAEFLGMPCAAINRIDVPYASLSRLAIYHTDQGTSKKLLGHNFVN